MLYRYSLAVAGVAIQMETEQPLAVTDQFRPFLTEACSADFRVRYRQVDALPAIPKTVIYEDQCYRVHPDGKGGYLRSFFYAPHVLTPYGVATSEGNALRVEYLESGRDSVSGMDGAFFHLGFEKLLIRKDRLCFHAACVQTSGGGLLFSGPSGIGKSTQADLWCRHRGAKQINGDRPILSRTETGWLAWGSPYAGSSRCHINESCPVSAVVMLRQAPRCALRRLGSEEAFRAVWSGLTMHSWDEVFVERACDLALELIDGVPVYEFACTPDEAAVDYLEGELRKEARL